MNMQTFDKATSNSLRGIMQLGIVLSHLSYTTAEPALVFSLANKLGTSIIAMFFFISGYGLMYNHRQRPIDLQSMGKRIWGIVKPMLCVSILFAGYSYLIGDGAEHYWIKNLVLHGTTPLPNSWFVFVLIWLYLSFGITFNLPRVNITYRLVLLALLSVLQISWSVYWGYERAWWVTTLAFESGCIYALYEKQIYRFMSRWWAMILSVIFVMGIIISQIEQLLVLPYTVIPIVAIVLLNKSGYPNWISTKERINLCPMLSFISNKLKSILTHLSEISYELYLVHGALIVILRGEYIYIYNDYLFALLLISSSIFIAKIIHKGLSFM